jgi:tripeptide aminopeptidase
MPINESRLVDDFIDLIRIDAPTLREAPVAERLEAQLRDLGFETSRDDAGIAIGGSCGNLYGFKKGSVSAAPPIMLNAHMDTVQPTANLVPVIEDGWIRTSGDTILGADDRGGIEAILEGVRAVTENDEPHGDLEIVFTISEETGLRGAKNLDFSRIRSSRVFVFDSGPPAGSVLTAAPTHEAIKARFKGKASHAAVAPEQGVNAIAAAARAISRLKLGRLDEKTTSNVGVIRGGQATNIVPEFVEVFAEARSRDPQRLASVVREMTEAFHAGAAEVGAEANVVVDRHYEGYEIAEDDEMIVWAKDAARTLGFEPSLRPGAGGSDANIFNARGLKAIVLGVGYLDPHGVNERIEIKEMVRAAEMARALILRAAQETAC